MRSKETINTYMHYMWIYIQKQERARERHFLSTENSVIKCPVSGHERGQNKNQLRPPVQVVETQLLEPSPLSPGVCNQAVAISR